MPNPAPAPAILRRLRVFGRVQGVGYRAALAHEAQALGLAGWVRNRTDGSVEALLLGDETTVLDLLDWSRRGPPHAAVSHIEVELPDNTETPAAGFVRRPTL